MKTLDMAKVTARYNRIMLTCCLEHVTIGTSFSEDTEGWNLRDMVAEADYWLDMYQDPNTASGEMRYDEDPDVRKIWRRDVGLLTRFIKAYEETIADMECTSRHTSKFDNRKE